MNDKSFFVTQSVPEFLLPQIYPSKAEILLWHIFRLFSYFMRIICSNVI